MSRDSFWKKTNYKPLYTPHNKITMVIPEIKVIISYHSHNTNTVISAQTLTKHTV